MPKASNPEMLRHQFFGEEQRAPTGPIPVVHRTRADYAQPPLSGLRATWIGWAGVLVEIDGALVLTDPVWSERCSPSTLVGPKRFHPPPIALEELPAIDLVVISHDHYDHLDMTVIQYLATRDTIFAVPLGIGAHLERWGVPASRIRELDWNETVQVGGLNVTSTKARHYSGRNPIRGQETLWSSWVVAGPRHRFFFSGDTGYSDVFREIGRVHGPFDLALIKIGASDPTWSDIHMSPEDAVQTAADIRAKLLLPVHWATFNLAFHGWRDPADEALRAARKLGVKIVMPRVGELVDIAAPPPVEEWWAPLGPERVR